MKDRLIIATACQDTVRIYTALATQLVEDARRIHDTWPTATAGFGRTLIGTLMMGVMSDNLYRLTVRVAGDGPLGGILAVSNEKGTVKGYAANPQTHLELNSQGKLDVARAVGAGQLFVTKDIGLKEPYQGVVPLQNSEIAEDFAYYFTKSEQTPSAVSLGVLVAAEGHVQAAGGLILQLMPGASAETITFLERKLANLPSMTSLISQGLSLTQIISEVMGPAAKIKILDELDICYKCDCSKERFQGPLLTLGASELNEIFQNSSYLEVRCHFCNEVYHFQRDELMTEDCHV